MKLPKDRPLYADLRTAFVRFPQLLGDLASRDFNGYVQFSGSHNQGTVFFASGEVQGSDVALDTIVRDAADPGGVVGVFEAPADLMTLVASLAQPEVLHKDLSSEFVDAMKLMEKLARDGHSGYVEFEISDGDAHGYLFLIGGDPVEAVYASPERFGSGLSMVPVILDDVEERGALMSVYGAVVEAVEETPVVAADVAASEFRNGCADEVVHDVRSPLAGGFVLASANAVNGPVFGSEPRATEAENKAPHDLAVMWGAILGSVESSVDEVSVPGTFSRGLREVLLERAKEMSFLDPTAGEFDYSHGTVHFRMMPPPEFSRVMGECLSDTIARISFRLRKVDLESSIQRHLETVVSEYADTLERFGMSRAASSFLAA